MYSRVLFYNVLFQYLCNKVNYVVSKSLENAVQMEYKALTDDMTGHITKTRLIRLFEQQRAGWTGHCRDLLGCQSVEVCQ